LGEDETVDNPLTGDDYPAVEDIQTAPPQEIVVSDSHSVAEIVAGNTEAPEAPTEANTDQEWYEVKRVLKTKRSRGKDLYLVEWANSPLGRTKRPHGLRLASVLRVSTTEA